MVSLSVCVFSDQSAARLSAIVAPLRGVAADIVVAIDDRVSDPDLTPLHGAADNVIVAPFSWPLEANLKWLHAQCSGDWVLRLDGDEVPSRSLVDMLALDEWHRDVTHCYLPRRWLVNEGTSWIRVNPWWPDTQLRLVKNDPELMSSGGRVHQTIDVDGPHRVLDAPIYHLDLVESDLDFRRSKGRRYYRAQPELRTHGGLSMGAFYTPELVDPYPPVAPVPPEDQALIHAVMARDYRSVMEDRSKRTRGELSMEAGKAVSVRVVHADRRGYSGRNLEILLTVSNTGSESLDPFSDYSFCAGAQWYGSSKTSVLEEARADLPCLLEPGESESVLMLARIPEPAGEYVLSIGVLEEGRQWLKRAPEIGFTVLDQPHVSLVAGYSRHRHLGDDLIVRSLIEELTNEFPQLRLTLLADNPESVADRFGVPTLDDSARIHHANVADGARGRTSVDRAISLAHCYIDRRELVDEAVASLVDVLDNSDAFVIAAAGSLTSAYSDAALWPRLIEAEIAHALDVPLAITSAGIGPFESDEHRDGAKRLLSVADEIHVRDQRSLRAAADLGIGSTAISVAPDAVFRYWRTEVEAVDRFLVSQGVDSGRVYLVASVRQGDDDRLVEQVARSVNAATATLDAVAVLRPHCASEWVDDRPALAGLAARLDKSATIVNLADIPPDPLAAELVRFATVSIGTRFHNGVLSASAGRPAILFCGSGYDRQRARGLAAWAGTRVDVMVESTKFIAARTRRLVKHQPQNLRYSDSHPIIDFVRSLGVGSKTDSHTTSRL